jgi:hypothetical protein
MGNHFIERVVKFDQLAEFKGIQDLIEFVIERAWRVLKRVKYKAKIPGNGGLNPVINPKMGYLKINNKPREISNISKTSSNGLTCLIHATIR